MSCPILFRTTFELPGARIVKIQSLPTIPPVGIVDLQLGIPPLVVVAGVVVVVVVVLSDAVVVKAFRFAMFVLPIEFGLNPIVSENPSIFLKEAPS